MAEEKKDEIKKPAEQAADAPKAEAKTAEPAPAAAAAEPAKAAEEKKEVKAERPANCISCNKSIKKRWYYRDGKFYCTKSCWQTAAKKAKAPEAEAKPQ